MACSGLDESPTHPDTAELRFTQPTLEHPLSARLWWSGGCTVHLLHEVILQDCERQLICLIHRNKHQELGKNEETKEYVPNLKIRQNFRKSS